MDSANYKFDYTICEGATGGNILIPSGSESISYTFSSSQTYPVYPLVTTLTCNNGSVYSWITTNKTAVGFTVEFSSALTAAGTLSWSIGESTVADVDVYEYYQTGGFRDFDSEASFDCTHGFDLVQITVEDVTAYLLQESGFYLLQQDGDRILL